MKTLLTLLAVLVVALSGLFAYAWINYGFENAAVTVLVPAAISLVVSALLSR
jgi:uncharacterized protein YxeA